MKLIKNAIISSGSSNNIKKVDILYDDKIREITENCLSGYFEEIIDLNKKLLIPGCIDAHVHFNDPGFTDHEDFITGTSAAAYGGITTIIDMPCTSIPPVTNVANLYKKLEIIQPKALIDFALWGGIRGNDLPLNKDMIISLWNEGVVGFKIYTISGMDSFKELSYEDIEAVFQKFPHFLFAFHAEDKNIIEQSLAQFAREDLKIAENYVKTRPVEAECEAVKQVLSIQKNNKVHFVHISSKKAAENIIRAKKYHNVTFETCPHYLQFTTTDLIKLKGRLKTTPPVKFSEDKEFLRNCLKEGLVDFITTDHAGCDFATEKNFVDFSKIYNGIPGTQLMIPYLFSEFYQTGLVSLKTLIELTSQNQAGRFGLYPQKGSLEIGTDADFTVIELNNKYKIEEKSLQSKGKYSPFAGKEFSSRIDKTIVRGEIVFDQNFGLKQNPGYGIWIKRNEK